MASFQAPRKYIAEIKNDLSLFKRTLAFKDIYSFIEALNLAVKGVSVSMAPAASPNVVATLDLLDTLKGWVDEIPPLLQPQRFGNKAFKIWHDKLHQVYGSDMTPHWPLYSDSSSYRKAPS